MIAGGRGPRKGAAEEPFMREYGAEKEEQRAFQKAKVVSSVQIPTHHL